VNVHRGFDTVHQKINEIKQRFEEF